MYRLQIHKTDIYYLVLFIGLLRKIANIVTIIINTFFCYFKRTFLYNTKIKRLSLMYALNSKYRNYIFKNKFKYYMI